jgi:ABC-2 type transport system permease protein/lipopolysaccharide transport system permease protein
MEALTDLVAGLRKSWLWGEMAKQDIRLRYRGSLLGPLWLTISTVVMIGSMGFLYAKLFHTPASSYLPFLTVGLIIWQFLASLITEGCGTFTAVSSVIQQVPMPYSVHVYRVVCRNLLVLGHNAVIIPFILWIFNVSPDSRGLWIPLALLVLCFNGVWISILFGMVSARFRDVPPIVGSFVQVIFFVTPIFWTTDALGKWSALCELNPLFAAIDVIRAPLLGVPLAPHSWVVLSAMTVVGWAATFAAFARLRYRIPFWV